MYLEEAVPEISKEVKLNTAVSAYKLMSELVNFTCNNIGAHNYRVVKRCFQVADKLYNNGNETVKTAVNNVFVYSFTKMFQAYSSEKNRLFALIPISLYSLYIKQVCHNGC